MSELLPVLSPEAIEKRVAEIARLISEDYQDGDLVMIGVLKGAFIFLADLVRCLTVAVTVDFIGASSYGSHSASSGTVTLTRTPGVDVRNKDVLLVEDIVDTGQTLAHLVAHFEALGARSVRICAMIDKHERREQKVPVAYRGFQIGEGFLVGYGLDYDEQYRQLPGIYHLKLNQKGAP